MVMDLGSLGQTCALCGLVMGAGNGVPGAFCSGHEPQDAMGIILQRVMNLEQAIQMMLAERAAAIAEWEANNPQAQQDGTETSDEISMTVAEGVDIDALADAVAEEVADSLIEP